MPSLNHFYKFLKSTLVRLIQDEANNPSNLMRPNSDFSRTRKLSIEDLAAVSFQTDDRSINRSLPFLPESLAQVSLSAITQARKKIKSSLFSNVFFRMNDAFRSEDDQTFKGWRLLAVDGSEISVCQDGKDRSTYGGSKKGFKHHFFHANPVYDVLNHVYIDLIMQPGSQKNEDSAFLDLARRYKGPEAIFTCDRGYEALMSFYRLNESGKYFVIRIKDENSAISLLKHYPTPDSEVYDIPFDVILTSKNNSHVKANRDTYKYISSYPHHPEFENGVTELPLHGRVVRYKAICDGNESLITLFTNLPFDEFSTEDLCEIYRLRWQIEISFRDMKKRIGLEHVHARKKELIIGEVFAKMTLYNLYSRLRNKTEKSQEFLERCQKARKRKWEQKVDYACLISAVQSFLWHGKEGEENRLIALILRKKQSIRPGRADKRKKNKR